MPITSVPNPSSQISGGSSLPQPLPATQSGGDLLPLAGDLGTIYQSPQSSGSNSGGGSTGSVSQGSGSGGLVINLVYDSSANGAPAAFKTAIADAVSYLESVISTPVTVNIDVGYGEIDGQALDSGALGESETYLESYSYSTIESALATVNPSAASSLPTSAPGTMWLATAQAKALGLAAASSDIDAYAGFSSIYPFTYDPNDRAVSGDYDFIGVVEHEFTEDMGRIDLFGENIGGTSNSYSLFDLYHYTSAGTHTYTGTRSNYFSADGGVTALDYFNSNPNGDLGDWASSAGSDSFLAFTPSGEEDVVSQADVTVMNALGFESLIAPVISVTNQTAADNQTVALTGIFSVAGSDVTQYQVWFSSAAAPALGSVTNNGTPIALDQAVTVTKLSGLNYIGGAVLGTDEIWLKAYDGVWDATWTQANITDLGAPPAAVTATDMAVAYNQLVPLTSLFSVSGSSVSQYQMWFSDPQLGAPALGSVTDSGTPIALNQAVTVTSLNGLDYVGPASTGPDVLWLRTYDGTWSTWAETTLTDIGAVTANDQSVSYGQSIALNSIFAINDPSGITQYQLWFSDPQLGFPADGEVTDNGTAIALNQAVTVSDLNGLNYIGGATFANDALWLRVDAGGTWSGWTQATITDPGVTPASITPNNTNATDSQSIALTNLFSVSGSGVTQYQVWFSDPQLGSPALGTVTNNGTPIALNQAVSVTSLNSLDYLGGATAGSDKIWLKAYDGVWSNWALANVTDLGASSSPGGDGAGVTLTVFGVGNNPPINFIPTLGATIAIAAGETLSLTTAFAGNVEFDGAGGTLQLGNPASFAGTVSGLGDNDAIDFGGIAFSAQTAASYSGQAGNSEAGTLSVMNGSQVAASVALLGNYLAATFVATSDGHGGTLVSEQPAQQAQTLLTQSQHS